jgi:hypothetical protein
MGIMGLFESAAYISSDLDVMEDYKERRKGGGATLDLGVKEGKIVLYYNLIS